MPGAYRAAIFVPVPIEHIVMAFYAPMTPIKLKYLLSLRAQGRMAGEAIDNFSGFFTGYFDNDVSLNGKDLAEHQGEGFAIIRRGAIFKGEADGLFN